MKINVPAKYQALWQKATPILKKARKDDLEHCRKTAEMVWELGKGENWDFDVLIPVAMLHDIGHAAVLPEHFYLISGPKREPNAKLVHMLTGAKISKELLGSLGYPAKQIKEIVDIILIHDKEDHTLFDTDTKRIFHDIDRLDRFSKETFDVTAVEFGITTVQAYDMLEKKVLPDFISEEFRELAVKKMAELRLIYK